MDGGRCRFRVHDDMRLVPGTDAGQDDDSDERDDTEPGDAALAVRQDDKRREQRSRRRPRIPADLKERLCEAMSATGSETCDARRFRVEDRRPDTHERNRNEDSEVRRRA